MHIAHILQFQSWDGFTGAEVVVLFYFHKKNGVVFSPKQVS